MNLACMHIMLKLVVFEAAKIDFKPYGFGRFFAHLQALLALFRWIVVSLSTIKTNSIQKHAIRLASQSTQSPRMGPSEIEEARNAHLFIVRFFVYDCANL